ncbi:uncharacterized protein LOC108735325 isoform X2 [Agrilus planipennis]|uniref:Uncharacterized protein LOC108735325 isoform X2 n=1 Tax=Agrilus planipennis TaxID=224129 RepID=A0A7F5RM20_AGRPL|nr:uncharacterized protein LOC108735325 isoform X2 [Agrilus planipennis]
MESQNCSKTKTPRCLWDSSKSDKKSVETNTDYKTCSCRNCFQLKLLDANVLNHSEPVNQQTIVNYKKAINYINSCHAIINEYITKTNNQKCVKCHAKSEDTINVNMPDLPDFIMLLSSLTALNKEGLCSKCSHGDCTSKSRSEEDSLKQNKKSSSRPHTASSICRKSESPEKIYGSSPSSESPGTTTTYDKKKAHTSHCTSRKNNRDAGVVFNKEDKYRQIVEDSGCCIPNNKKSSIILTSSTDEAKIHTKSAPISRKLAARTIHSVSVTDESENEHKTVSTTVMGNFITEKNIAKKKYKCKGNKFEMGDASTDLEPTIQRNSSGTETSTVCNDPKHQGNGREHDDNFQALYAIIGQQLLQGNQMMPVQKVIDILKNQAFSPLTISESLKDNSTRETTSNSETRQDTSTDTNIEKVAQCHEKIGHCSKRHRTVSKDKEQALHPPLVSQRDIENYTTELMETLQRDSSQETTPRYTNTGSTTQSFDLEEDYSTSDKRDESRKMSQTRIPTAVRGQIKRSSSHHSPPPPLTKNENCISCVKEAQNLVSSSSNEYQVATSDDQRECSDCGNVILSSQETTQQQQQQPFLYSAQRTTETNCSLLQQDLPPYVVQQKRSDHFVCNRQRRREKGRNAHCGSPRGLDQRQSYYEQNMSSIQNIPEEGEYAFEEEENAEQNENSPFKKSKQQPEKEKCSTGSIRSRTDSSEIETDKDEIIKQFTPRKIIIDSNGATTKMKCVHK